MGARGEILNLIYRYAELMDSGDFAGIGALFEDGQITLEGSSTVLIGAQQVTEAYVTSAHLYPDTGTPKTRHVITNVIVEVSDDGRTASSRSYFIVLQAVEGQLPLQPILAGRYRDTFACVDGTWRFRTMHITWDLLGDLSAHLMQDLQ
jgi:3-phenylpropionate/cinnamic acid dioxygenase small subunit